MLHLRGREDQKRRNRSITVERQWIGTVKLRPGLYCAARMTKICFFITSLFSLSTLSLPLDLQL